MSTTQPTPAKPAPRPKSAGKNGAPAAAKPAPAAPPESAAQQAETHEEPAPAASGFAFSCIFLAVPSWLVSLLFHICLLLALALFTFSNPEMRKEIFQTSSLEKEEVEELEESG